MLTVKFMKYGPQDPANAPTYTESEVIHSAKVVYIEFDKHQRTVLKLENPQGEQESFTVGETGRNDVMFNTVYVMNEAGRTVETIR